jgi:pimeloyl-ACP methyl ester carboxylesterase
MKDFPTRPSIVLVHGAFADGSGWKKVIPLLEAEGFAVTAVQNAMKSLADDIATTKRVIEAQKGDVILVGHSYGGAVITGAATGSDKVKALVYVAAFAPDEGETLGGLIEKFPATLLGTSLVPDSAGFLYIDRAKFHDVFCGDVEKEEASIMGATQRPIAGAIFGEASKEPAWKSIPSWYAVSTGDHAVHPELERFMAKRMKAEVTELEASHVSFLSQPDKIVDIIYTAVEETAA